MTILPIRLGVQPTRLAWIIVGVLLPVAQLTISIRHTLAALLSVALTLLIRPRTEIGLRSGARSA